MTGRQTSHITVSYKEGGNQITHIYAINEDVSRELRQETQKPTGKALKAWLEEKGCLLDSAGGPAFVRRTADGSTDEEYYRDGKRHREEGPATVWRFADGSTYEWYYRNGQLHRSDGPAVFGNSVYGSTYESYYLDGVDYQKDAYDAKTRPLLAGDRTEHITVTYRGGSAEFTRIYAINEEILRELRQETQKPTGKALKAWLENKGCRLDSSDDPAYVWRSSHGTAHEWYRDGKLHREDSPATIWRSADGTTSEQYFLDGVEYQKDAYDAKMNALLTGLRVPLANGGQDTIETLLREAMAEQSAPHTLAAGRPDGQRDDMSQPSHLLNHRSFP